MKKIPTWTIYLADLMCVISALMIAGTYFSVGLPMDALVAALCALMVLSATAIICTAQLVQLKYAKLSNEKSDIKQIANIEENFQILFKQVSAIKRDNATLNSNFGSLLSRVSEISKASEDGIDSKKILGDIANIRAKFEELENKVAKDEDIATLKLEVDESLENLRADVELDLGKLDDIDKAVKELKDIIESLSNNSIEAEHVLEETEEEPEEFEKEDNESESFDADLNVEDEESDADEEFEDIDDGVDPSDDLSQISLMSRALNNTQQAQSILGSFAKINENTSNADPIEDNTEDDNDFVDIDDDLDLDDDLADIMNLGTDAPQDAILTINAMLGLGNKPYIRGTASGLSESEGQLMEFVEIGKWRYVFKDLTQKTKVSIWLNDEKISDNGEIFINEGELVEIDVNFSQ